MVRSSDTAFVAATRSPPLKSPQDGYTAGSLRGGSDGINSGVLVLDLERMRAFATRYCPRRPWWMCVIDDKNESSYDWHGDQWVWIHLLQRKPGLWYELPCGLHAEVDVLRGAAIQLIVGATRVGAHNVHALCDPLVLKAGGPKLRAQNWTATLANIGSEGCRRHSSARAPRMISAGGASALLILCHRVMARG